jgi:hypothetical protein
MPSDERETYSGIELKHDLLGSSEVGARCRRAVVDLSSCKGGKHEFVQAESGRACNRVESLHVWLGGLFWNTYRPCSCARLYIYMIEYMRDWLRTRHLPKNPDLPFSKMMTAYACQTGGKSAVTKDLHCCLSYHLFLPSPTQHAQLASSRVTGAVSSNATTTMAESIRSSAAAFFGFLARCARA